MHENAGLASLCSNNKWHKTFAKDMFDYAKYLSDWKAVVRKTKQGSRKWKTAISKVISMTKGTTILYRWEQLRDLLPEDHGYYLLAKIKIREIKAERRKNKKK